MKLTNNARATQLQNLCERETRRIQELARDLQTCSQTDEVELIKSQVSATSKRKAYLEHELYKELGVANEEL
ncbi:hypothetical protein ABVF11_02030 [Pediococcus argentinicus]|uniref:hypothetical protein n=1 Tax=Pediococcus argentinicus TaxID=480391 RepID=UPI00338F77A0